MRTPRLLQRRPDGTLTLLIGATCLLMLLAAAAALALNGAAHALQDQAGRRLLVQIVESDAARQDDVANEVLARLDRLGTPVHAERVPAAQAAALVDPYLSGMDLTEIPLPGLIEVQGIEAAEMALALHGLSSAHTISAGSELAPIIRLFGALRAIALGVTLTAAAAVALMAMLAARAALARETNTLGILHALGATDAQTSRLLTGGIARDAAIGAAAGSAVALLLILAMKHRLAAGAQLGFGSWTVLLLLPAVIAALAAGAAQVTLAAMLRRAL